MWGDAAQDDGPLQSFKNALRRFGRTDAARAPSLRSLSGGVTPQRRLLEPPAVSEQRMHDELGRPCAPPWTTANKRRIGAQQLSARNACATSGIIAHGQLRSRIFGATRALTAAICAGPQSNRKKVPGRIIDRAKDSLFRVSCVVSNASTHDFDPDNGELHRIMINRCAANGQNSFMARPERERVVEVKLNGKRPTDH